MPRLWIFIDVIYAANFWGHETNFHEVEDRCHEAEDEAEAIYYKAQTK